MGRIVLIDPAGSAPEVPSGHWDVHARDILPARPVRVQLCEMSPGGGAEPHVHPHQDQIFIVTDGRLEVEDGSTEPAVAVQSEQAVVIPAGIRHGTKNLSDSETRYIVITYPSRQEDLMTASRDRLPIPRPSESVLVDRTGADPGEVPTLYERGSSDPRTLSDPSDGSACILVVASPDQGKLDAQVGFVAPGGTLVVVGAPSVEASLDGAELVLTERNVTFVERYER